MSNYLPHGLSRNDLVYVGSLPDLDDQCEYFEKNGDHKRQTDDDGIHVCESCGLGEDCQGNVVIEPDQGNSD